MSKVKSLTKQKGQINLNGCVKTIKTWKVIVSLDLILKLLIVTACSSWGAEVAYTVCARGLNTKLSSH